MSASGMMKVTPSQTSSHRLAAAAFRSASSLAATSRFITSTGIPSTPVPGPRRSLGLPPVS